MRLFLLIGLGIMTLSNVIVTIAEIAKGIQVEVGRLLALAVIALSFAYIIGWVS